MAEEYPPSEPRRHLTMLQEMLTDVVERAREGVEQTDEPKAQALLETLAEVCTALVTTIEHYEGQSEPAWQR